ncbi:MAG TPA: glycosyltransferase N-terminal domain-containing protein [bacterium]|nr:glycosyltransferase N-terminal domain-containing protein [bacterium]HPN42271.1 glycosyltransferase N-terminal domain-containing protein [bacterium]
MPLLYFLVYNILFIPCFFILVQIACLFNNKVRRGVKGRKGLFTRLQSSLAVKAENEKRVWLHISSMGEFEQSRPIIDEIRKRMPDTQIILSLFSPSAYDNIRIEDKKIFISYLPMDSYLDTKKFIRIIAPDVALTVRHDIWPNFQWQLKRLKIPALLVDGSITDKRKNLYSFFRNPIRSVMETYSWILTVSQESSERFEKIYSDKSRIQYTGDTRYDRVYQRSRDNSRIEFLQQSGFFDRENTFVAGSTWPSDEKILYPALLKMMTQNNNFKLIIAPHEPSVDHVQAIENFFAKNQLAVERLSRLKSGEPWSFRALVIDKIGLLANLYSLGRLAFVGGGFGPGVHNVLEPAAHGCAVFFGPRYNVSVEPQLLIDSNGACSIASENEADDILKLLIIDPARLKTMGDEAQKFILDNMGASTRIVDIVEQYLKSH